MKQRKNYKKNKKIFLHQNFLVKKKIWFTTNKPKKSDKYFQIKNPLKI